MNLNIKLIFALVSIAIIPTIYSYTLQQFDSESLKSGSYLINPKPQFDDSKYQLFPIGEHRFDHPISASCYSKSDQSFLVAEKDGRIVKVSTAKDGFVKTKEVHNINSALADGSPDLKILDFQCRTDYLDLSTREFFITTRRFAGTKPPLSLYIGKLSADNEDLSAFSMQKPAIVLKNIAANQSNPKIIFGPGRSIIFSFQTSPDGYLTSQDAENLRGKIVVVTPTGGAEASGPCVITFKTSFGTTKNSNCGAIQIAALGISRPRAMLLSANSQTLKILDEQIGFGIEFNEIRLGATVNLGWPYVAGYEVFRKTSIDLSKTASPTLCFSVDKGWISDANIQPGDEDSEKVNNIFYALMRPGGPSLYTVNNENQQSEELDIPNIGRGPVELHFVGKMTVLTRNNSTLSILAPKGLENQFTNIAIESKFLYSQYCETCHGNLGKSSYLGIRDLEGGDWTTGENPGNAIRAISEGVPNKMPAFSSILTAQQIRGLSIYLESFTP